MHITNLLLKSVLSSALSLASLSIFAADSTEHHIQDKQQRHTDHEPTATTHHHEQYIKMPVTSSHEQQYLSHQEHMVSAKPGAAAEHDHRKEHGAQVYARVVLDQKWQLDSKENGSFKSDNEARIGNDENKIFLKLQTDKSESESAEYDAKVLYSRNISDFWDAQAGLRYHQENTGHDAAAQTERFDAVFGLHGLAPYFFETNAYLYLGENDFVGLKLETERDLLLTQKLILQPYAEFELILNDQAEKAKRSGLNHAALGLETRYEINKRIMPYFELGYEYAKGNKKATVQQASYSDKGWIYAAGLRMMF